MCSARSSRPTARKRPPRTRVEKGIYLDRWGYSAIVTVRGRQQEKRFPLDTERELIRRERHQMAIDLDDFQGVGLNAPRDTLAADVRTYLQRREGRPGFKADRSHFKAWIALYGPKHRRLLTEQDIETALATWRSAKVAPQTIKHRVRALRQLYLALDGRDVKNPLRHVEVSIPRAAPTAVPLKVIQRVAKNLAKSKQWVDHARFLVRATTGQRPSQIMRAVPADVDLVRRVWFVRPAKGGDPIPLPLNVGMVRAWQALKRANAWGHFDTSAHAKACQRAGWPAGTRLYNLRHTFAIDLLLGGTDLGDIQGLLGHADIQTTREAYAPILVSRLTKAVKRRRLTL